MAARLIATPTAVHAASRTAPIAATVLMGLIAGFFYAYACSVMIGLGNADDRTFIVAMQEINASVRNAWFAPSFFGSLLVTGIAAILAAMRSDRAVLSWTSAALVLYAGAFLITMGISVPLNDELATAGPVDRITDLAAVRAAYEDAWVRWNIARSLASTLALARLVRALLLHDRPRVISDRWRG
jgi:uncharacterized membrane protein